MKSKKNLMTKSLGLKYLEYDLFARMIGLSGRQKWMVRKYIMINFFKGGELK